MAINSELLKRVITSILGIPIILGLILWGDMTGTMIFVLGISLFMMKEWSSHLFNLSDRKIKTILAISLLPVFQIGTYYFSSDLIFPILFLIAGAYFVYSYGRHSPSEAKQHINELGFFILGFVYLGILPIFLLEIRENDNGLTLLCLFIFSIWSMDIGAYFIGKRFGKTRLLESVSPKKSFEGLIGGVVLTAICGLIFHHYFLDQFDLVRLIMICIVVGVVSQLGDLVESMFKRALGVKDFGSTLPGHGGFLDRFDGVIFAAPIMHICVTMF